MVHFLLKLPISLISSFWVENGVLKLFQISKRCSVVNPAGKCGSKITDTLLIPGGKVRERYCSGGV